MDKNIEGDTLRSSVLDLYKGRTYNRATLKIKISDLITVLLFIGSFFDPILLALTLFYIIYAIGNDGIICGCMKSLLFISFRSILNPGISNSYTNMGVIKWMMLLSLAFIIIVSATTNADRKKSHFLYMLCIFVVYLVVDSLIVSGYPTVSIFKIISWIFVFFALIRGMYAAQLEDKIVKFLSLLLDLIIIVSPFAYPLGVAFLRNGYSFQGITNQPNMLGVIALMTFGLNLYLKNSKNKYYVIIVSGLCIVEGILTKSRTCIFGIVLLVIIYLLFNEKSILKKTYIVLCAMILCMVMFFLAQGYISEFIFKGQNTTDFIGAVIASRGGQISNAINKFKQNVIIGNGFMVPINPIGKSYAFSFDLTVEPGNIILTLLSDTGVIGFLLFFAAFFFLFCLSRREDRILFFIPFIITMTEMNFFSTNNLAVVYYVLFAYCLKRSSDKNKNIGNYSLN